LHETFVGGVNANWLLIIKVGGSTNANWLNNNNQQENIISKAEMIEIEL